MKNILFLLSIAILFSCNQKEKTQNQKKSKLNIKAYELKSATLAAGKLIRVDSFPSKNIKPRPVDVWLPENYSDEKKYAVLYMHDGQNLFDSLSTWNKQEWMIDEVATELMRSKKTKDFIVVGIHNIPQIRWLDLFPEKALQNLSQTEIDEAQSISNSKVNLNDFKGDEYLQFLVKELKPYVDKTYAVHTNKENTFVAGSSMGGLMSMYAISEYPNVFEGAACISTHWPGAMPSEHNPFPNAIFKYAAENIPKASSHKLYFDYGNKTLDQFYPKYAPKVDSIYLNNGYSENNFKNLFFEGTNHSERSWQKRVDIPIAFLLKK
ncbi:alpha/beta hydrolase [Polaribacter sp. R77954]|uniref:alpha/beta hydrolase n=1 Tax=Polaribacter sp. R77954 TaxID=3093870 RepID=UPI0037C94171